jgi:hypothetical protein
MEHVLRFMLSGVRIAPYNTSVGPLELPLAKRLKKEALTCWVKSAYALLQTCKPTPEEKAAWVAMSYRYLVQDRVSTFRHPNDRTVKMTHEKAAQHFALEAGDLGAEIARVRRGRRRFPHH